MVSYGLLVHSLLSQNLLTSPQVLSTRVKPLWPEFGIQQQPGTPPGTGNLTKRAPGGRYGHRKCVDSLMENMVIFQRGDPLEMLGLNLRKPRIPFFGQETTSGVSGGETKSA